MPRSKKIGLETASARPSSKRPTRRRDYAARLTIQEPKPKPPESATGVPHGSSQWSRTVSDAVLQPKAERAGGSRKQTAWPLEHAVTVSVSQGVPCRGTNGQYGKQF